MNNRLLQYFWVLAKLLAETLSYHLPWLAIFSTHAQCAYIGGFPVFRWTTWMGTLTVCSSNRHFLICLLLWHSHSFELHTSWLEITTSWWCVFMSQPSTGCFSCFPWFSSISLGSAIFTSCLQQTVTKISFRGNILKLCVIFLAPMCSILPYGHNNNIISLPAQCTCVLKVLCTCCPPYQKRKETVVVCCFMTESSITGTESGRHSSKRGA